MNLKTNFLVSLCLSFFLLACSNNKDTQEEAKQGYANKFISLKTIENKTIKAEKINKGFYFSNAKNKAVLLSFITSWCPPCKAEIPHLNNLAQKYKDKLEIIGVLLEKNELSEIEKFVQKYKIAFTVTYGANNYDIAKAVGDVEAIPFMILYDKKGQYFTHYMGAIPEEMIDADIKKAIQ